MHIKSYDEYIKLLTDLVKNKGNTYLDSISINKFIKDYNLDHDYGINYTDVYRDSFDIVRKIDNKKKRKPEHKVNSYEQYLRLLENTINENKNNRLSAWQVDAFIWKYNLSKDWKITRDDVFKDMDTLLKKAPQKKNIQKQNNNPTDYKNKKIKNEIPKAEPKIVSKDSDECLKRIVKEYSELLLNCKRMKALLLDFYPTEKLKRNLLLACVEENIVKELLKKTKCEKTDIYRYEKRIIEAHGCSSEKAHEMVELWISALEIKII